MLSLLNNLLIGLLCCIFSVSAQQSIDSQDGFGVGRNCGIAVAIYGTTLILVPLTINIIRKYIVMKAQAGR